VPTLSPTQRSAVIELLTTRTDPSYTPSLAQGAREVRTAYLKTLADTDLLDELDWFRGHWGGTYPTECAALQNVMYPPSG